MLLMLLPGMDVYSLHSSAAKVIEYLEKVDADAAARARARYRCFDKWVPPMGSGRGCCSFSVGPTL